VSSWYTFEVDDGSWGPFREPDVQALDRSISYSMEKLAEITGRFRYTGYNEPQLRKIEED